MKQSPILRSLSAIVAIGLFSMPNLLYASGGDDFSENAFAPQYRVPLPELQDYAAGRLGIVTPNYWRVYQFLAYRALTGRPLSRPDMDKLSVKGFSVGEQTGAYDYAYSEEVNGVAKWRKAREAVRGAAVVDVGVETNIGDFSIIINCPSDAFARAASTLAQRVAQHGQLWAATWLAGQDAVFANCSPKLDQEQQRAALLVRPLTLPPPLPAKAPAWLQKDDAYQRAAAHFYAGRFEQARAQFTAIGNDPASPWQPLGAYLAARSLIRSAVVPADLAAADARRAIESKLGTARAELAALGASYAPAQRLVDWIDVRIRPDERRRELSAMLAVQAVGAATAQNLTDYLFLMDRLEPAAMMGAADPMTAWIGAMQAGSRGRYADKDDAQTAARRLAALELSRSQWGKKREQAWLLAILVDAHKGALTAAERKAAEAVKADSPAFVTLQYHLARHALADGRASQADAIVSSLLKAPLPVSARNRVLRMKMVTAPTAEASLAAAARTPAEQERGVPVPNEGKPQAATPLYDSDLRAHLESHLPLATLVKLKGALPPSEQRAAAELIWTRAVLLGQYDAAAGATDDVAQGRASTRHLYERFKKAATPEGKRDAALLILANAPELVPQVSRGDNDSVTWSCMGREASDDAMDTMPPAFLTAGERYQAGKELAQLRALQKRSSYLIPLVMDWAKRNKADPEAPKALHFLIASTRNECGSSANDNSGRHYSKEAFEFLHKTYPKNEWTVKTRYYY